MIKGIYYNEDVFFIIDDTLEEFKYRVSHKDKKMFYKDYFEKHVSLDNWVNGFNPYGFILVQDIDRNIPENYEELESLILDYFPEMLL